MSDQNEVPELHPDYVPATQDSGISIRFIGNTAIVAQVGLDDANPFQMLAASQYLRMQAEKMIYRAENAVEREYLARQQAEAQRGQIQVAQKLPTGVDLPGK